MKKDYETIFTRKLKKEGWEYVLREPKPFVLTLPRWESPQHPMIKIRFCLGFLDISYMNKKKVQFKMSETSSYTIEEHIEAAMSYLFENAL